MASNRVEVAANGDLEDLANCRMVFACSGIDVQKHDSREIINALRHIEETRRCHRRDLHRHLPAGACWPFAGAALHHPLGKP